MLFLIDKKSNGTLCSVSKTSTVFVAMSIPPSLHLFFQPSDPANLLRIFEGMAIEIKSFNSEDADSNVMFKKRHVVRKGNKRKVTSDDDSS